MVLALITRKDPEMQAALPSQISLCFRPHSSIAWLHSPACLQLPLLQCEGPRLEKPCLSPVSTSATAIHGGFGGLRASLQPANLRVMKGPTSGTPNEFWKRP